MLVFCFIFFYVYIMIRITNEAEIYFEKNIEKNSKPPAPTSAVDLIIPLNSHFLNTKSYIRAKYNKLIYFLKPKTVFNLKIFLGKHSMLFADYKMQVKE